MKHKNLRSSKTQLFFFTAMPSILVYIGVVLLVIGAMQDGTMMIPGIFFVLIGILWSFVGGFICAANMSLIKAIGAPRRSTVKIGIGRQEMSASLKMEFSVAQAGQFITNVFFSVILTLPVAILGWLLFILYCKGKFLSKTRLMMIDCDDADEIIRTGKASIDNLASCFYRMIDYVEVYKNLGEKKGANEMLDRAQKLLAIWERLEAQYGEA